MILRRPARAFMLAAGVAAVLPPVLADARPAYRGGASTSVQGGAAPPGPTRGSHGAAGAFEGRNLAGQGVGNRASFANAPKFGETDRRGPDTSAAAASTVNSAVAPNPNATIDVDDHWRDWNDGPLAAGVAIGTAASATAAAVGSTTSTLPSGCGPERYAGYTYYNCAGVWYEPRYEGDNVVYKVVTAPS